MTLIALLLYVVPTALGCGLVRLLLRLVGRSGAGFSRMDSLVLFLPWLVWQVALVFTPQTKHLGNLAELIALVAVAVVGCAVRLLVAERFGAARVSVGWLAATVLTAIGLAYGVPALSVD